MMDYKKMDIEALNKLMLEEIQALEQQGSVIDNLFRVCHSLKEANGPLFFLNLITNFLSDAKSVIKEIRALLDTPFVELNDTKPQAIKLRGAATSIGAFRIGEACWNLRDAIERDSRLGCISALHQMENEYKNLCEKLKNIVKLEREIVSRTA